MAILCKVKGPIVYYVPEGGGGFGGGRGVQFLKRVNFENVQSVRGVEILRHRIEITCCSCKNIS